MIIGVVTTVLILWWLVAQHKYVSNQEKSQARPHLTSGKRAVEYSGSWISMGPWEREWTKRASQDENLVTTDFVFKLHPSVSFPAKKSDMVRMAGHNDPKLHSMKYCLTVDQEVSIAAHLYMLQQQTMHNHEHFMDIGMNFGYFTLLMANAGAVTWAFEPQRSCHAVCNTLLERSGPLVRSRATLFNYGLGAEYQLLENIPEVGCDVGEQFRKNYNDDTIHTRFDVEIITWQNVWGPDINNVPLFFAVKMDTEGAEIKVLKGLLPLFEAGKIRNFMVEIVGGAWEAYGVTTDEGVRLLKSLVDRFDFEAYAFHDFSEPERNVGLGEYVDLRKPGAHPHGWTCDPYLHDHWMCGQLLRPVLDWEQHIIARTKEKVGGNYLFAQRWKNYRTRP